MKHFFLALVCILLVAGNTLAADTVYGVDHAEERVITLPQDQGQWYISLFGELTDPQFQALHEWFYEHNGLNNLRGQVHYNEYATTGIRYPRYAKTLPGLPCVRVQNSQGKVISEFWAEYIPMTSSALYNGICADMRKKVKGVKTGGPFRCIRRAPRTAPLLLPIPHLKQRCCPKPAPVPEPTPVVDAPPVVDTPPAVPQPSFPWLLLGASLIVGGGIGVAQGYQAQYYPKPAALKIN